MNYSEKQLERLKYLLLDHWVSEDPIASEKNLDQALSAIENSSELHQFAGNFNADGGIDVLRKIINHPLCDKGTALMIYCMGRPGYYYRQLEKRKSLRPSQQEVFELLQEIEEKYQANEFTFSSIKFDPHDAVGQDLLKESSANPGNRLVPEIMSNPTPGEFVEIIEIV